MAETGRRLGSYHRQCQLKIMQYLGHMLKKHPAAAICTLQPDSEIAPIMFSTVPGLRNSPKHTGFRLRREQRG